MPSQIAIFFLNARLLFFSADFCCCPGPTYSPSLVTDFSPDSLRKSGGILTNSLGGGTGVGNNVNTAPSSSFRPRAFTTDFDINGRPMRKQQLSFSSCCGTGMGGQLSGKGQLLLVMDEKAPHSRSSRRCSKRRAARKSAAERKYGPDEAEQLKMRRRVQT